MAPRREGHRIGQTQPVDACDVGIALASTVLSAAIATPVAAPGLVNDDGAAAFFGCSKRSFLVLMTEAWMPLPINLGPRMRRWSIDELRAAVAKMPRQTARSQPESLLRARIDRMKATGVAA